MLRCLPASGSDRLAGRVDDAPASCGPQRLTRTDVVSSDQAYRYGTSSSRSFHSAALFADVDGKTPAATHAASGHTTQTTVSDAAVSPVSTLQAVDGISSDPTPATPHDAVADSSPQPPAEGSTRAPSPTPSSKSGGKKRSKKRSRGSSVPLEFHWGEGTELLHTLLNNTSPEQMGHVVVVLRAIEAGIIKTDKQLTARLCRTAGTPIYNLVRKHLRNLPRPDAAFRAARDRPQWKAQRDRVLSDLFLKMDHFQWQSLAKDFDAKYKKVQEGFRTDNRNKRARQAQRSFLLDVMSRVTGMPIQRLRGLDQEVLRVDAPALPLSTPRSRKGKHGLTAPFGDVDTPSDDAAEVMQIEHGEFDPMSASIPDPLLPAAAGSSKPDSTPAASVHKPSDVVGSVLSLYENVMTPQHAKLLRSVDAHLLLLTPDDWHSTQSHMQALATHPIKAIITTLKAQVPSAGSVSAGDHQSASLSSSKQGRKKLRQKLEEHAPTGEHAREPTSAAATVQSLGSATVVDAAMAQTSFSAPKKAPQLPGLSNPDPDMHLVSSGAQVSPLFDTATVTVTSTHRAAGAAGSSPRETAQHRQTTSHSPRTVSPSRPASPPPTTALPGTSHTHSASPPPTTAPTRTLGYLLHRHTPAERQQVHDFLRSMFVHCDYSQIANILHQYRTLELEALAKRHETASNDGSSSHPLADPSTVFYPFPPPQSTSFPMRVSSFPQELVPRLMQYLDQAKGRLRGAASIGPSVTLGSKRKRSTVGSASSDIVIAESRSHPEWNAVRRQLAACAHLLSSEILLTAMKDLVFNHHRGFVCAIAKENSVLVPVAVPTAVADASGSVGGKEAKLKMVAEQPHSDPIPAAAAAAPDSSKEFTSAVPTALALLAYDPATTDAFISVKEAEPSMRALQNPDRYTKLHLKNLPADATPGMVARGLASFGTVVAVEIYRDHVASLGRKDLSSVRPYTADGSATELLYAVHETQTLLTRVLSVPRSFAADAATAATISPSSAATPTVALPFPIGPSPPKSTASAAGPATASAPSLPVLPAPPRSRRSTYLQDLGDSPVFAHVYIDGAERDAMQKIRNDLSLQVFGVVLNRR